MGLEWKPVSYVATKDTVKEIKRKAVYPHSFTESIKHLEYLPKKSSLVFKHNTANEIQDYANIIWKPVKNEFVLKTLQEEKDVLKNEILDHKRKLQFNINEMTGIRGKGFNKFIKTELPNLLESGYVLEYARIIFTQNKFFPKKQESVTFRFDTCIILQNYDEENRSHTARLELGKTAKHKKQLNGWFNQIPGPTFDRYYI